MTPLRLSVAAGWVSEITLMILFFLVPLFFWSATSELFEFNKMILVYLAASVLLASETIRLANLPKPELVRPRLLVPGIILLISLTLATIFSTDQHVSLFGYFDRWQGGLFSWLAYGVIYFALTQQPRDRLLDLLKVNLASGILIALWGISEHFGHSPSCFLLNHSFDDNCWVEDVKDRVFATLGQPNWMAAYLGMLIPWALGLYLSAKRSIERGLWFAGVIVLYLSFIFSYSRGGSVGLAVGLGLFLLLLGRERILTLRKLLIPLTALMLILTIIFATPLTEKIFGQAPPRGLGTVASGNDTGPTRLVVWQTAWNIFVHNPLIGTGLETFGESFYNYRVPEMNKTPEWDYLFNKAHNEYLNYLGTTGLIGLSSYLLLLAAFFYLGWKKLRRSGPEDLLIIGSLTSVAGYLTQNIFSFTVVPLALIFIFDLTTLDWNGPTSWHFNGPRVWNKIKPFHPELAILIPAAFLLVEASNLWRANLAYAQGLGSLSVGEDSLAELNLTLSTRFDPWEPNYQIELGMAKANLAQLSGPGQTGEKLAGEAKAWSDRATTTSPDNLYLWRRRATLLEELIKVSSSYRPLAEQARLKAVQLAPNEPKVTFELAQFYRERAEIALARQYFLKANQLKPDWLDPLLSLTETEIEQNNLQEAKIYLSQAQALAPNDPQVIALTQKAGP